MSAPYKARRAPAFAAARALALAMTLALLPVSYTHLTLPTNREV